MRNLIICLTLLVFVTGCGNSGDKVGTANDPPKKSIESELIGTWATDLYGTMNESKGGVQEINPDGKAVYNKIMNHKDKITQLGSWKWIADRKFKLTRKEDPTLSKMTEFEVELQYNDTIVIKRVGGTDEPLTYKRVRKPGEIRK